MKKFPLIVLSCLMLVFLAVGCSTVGSTDDTTVRPPVPEGSVQGYFVVENDVLSEDHPLTSLAEGEYVAYYLNGEEGNIVGAGYGWTSAKEEESYGKVVLDEKGMYEIKVEDGSVSAEKLVGNYVVLSVADDGILTSEDLTPATFYKDFRLFNIIVISEDGEVTVGNYADGNIHNFGDEGTYLLKAPGKNFLSL